MSVPLIELKKDFIANEIVNYVKEKYKNFSFDKELLRRDAHIVVDIFMGELKIKGGVYAIDIDPDKSDDYLQLNRYKKSFTVLNKINDLTIDVMEKLCNSIKNILNSDKNFPKEKIDDVDIISSLIVSNMDAIQEETSHTQFIDQYFDKGFIVTKIPQNLMSKFWDEVNNTKWVDAKLTTYKKVPDWYHENKKHYVDPTGMDRPTYEKKLGSDIFTNAPESIINLSKDLIADPFFDPLKMYRPPNPIPKYIHFWNGSENSPHHVDSIDGSDLMIFCYLTEAEEWKEEWGGYINLMKQVNSEVIYSKTVLPNNGVMVVVNNSSPIFKHGIRNLINRDVNRYTFIFHYTWTY